MSSIEAEYIATAEASMKAVWMRKFIDGLGGVIPSNKRPIEMLCDNEPALAIVLHVWIAFLDYKPTASLSKGISGSIDDVARLFVNVSMLYNINETFASGVVRVSERRNRMVRSMINLTTLPKSYWEYALETATRILNMVPTKKVVRTPYEIWHGKAPKLSYLRVWVVRHS
ncbi:retrotransposon protein, putative, ty1-copia subclass [Tanacetum coccineum]